MAYLQGTAFHSLHNDSNAPNQRRKSESQAQKPSIEAGLISPLLRLFKDPTGTLEEFIERAWTKPPPDPAAIFVNAEDAETRTLLLNHRMQTAEDYATWQGAAIELDQLDGSELWKLDPVSDYYDYKLLRTRLDELNHARISGDPKRMLFVLRTSLTRGLANMGDARLYKHTRVGTKKLIDDYIAAACETMDVFMEHMNSNQSCGIDRRDALQQLLNARQSFGRSALLLSGGGTWGMTHIGVVRTLWETKLLPRIVCGSSAGSIICSVLCAKTDFELEETLLEMCTGDLDVFEKSGEEENFLRKAARFAKHGCLFDISHLTRVMRGLLGDLTFQEAYYRTGRLLNIAVSGSGLHEMPRLLNYVTAPNVIIWSAVIASCSVPFIFEPITLMAKDQHTGESIPWNPNLEALWIDGSVDCDLPMTQLSEMFNVNHFIVSQVNPHVIPFLMGDENILPGKAVGSKSMTATGLASSWLNNVASIAKSEACHRMHVFSELGLLPNFNTKMRSIMSQKYAGDITILPEIGFSQFPLILKNPTPVFMLSSMLTGMRATWPHFARIQNHCAIELALDKMTQELRTHIVFSPSQVDLRLASLAPRDVTPSRGAKRRPRHRAKTKSWCADTPYSLAGAHLQMTPERSSANNVAVSAEWNTGAETELTAHESFSEDDDEDDREFLSFGKILRKKTKSSSYKKHSGPLSEPTSPKGTPTVATFSQSLKRLFPNGSNPGTPRPAFQSLSSVIGDLRSSESNNATNNAAIRFALSQPEGDYLDGAHAPSPQMADLKLTKSMIAEQPARAQGVATQVERKNAALATEAVAAADKVVPVTSHASTASAPAAAAAAAAPASSKTDSSASHLDGKSIKNMIKRRKGGAARS